MNARLTRRDLLAERPATRRFALVPHGVLTDEYFLAFAVRPSGNFGKARYVLRVLAPKIRAEL